MIEATWRLLLDVALWLLSHVVPKSQGRVALGADLATTYKGNPRYVFEHMVEHPDQGFEPVWITEDDATLRRLAEDGFPVLSKFTLRAFWVLLRAEFLIIDFTPRDLLYLGEAAFGRFRFIQTAHGMPIKKGGQLALEEGRGRRPRGVLRPLQPAVTWLKCLLVYNVLLANYELVVAQSEESRRDLSELYVNDNVEVLGAPRNDVYFRDEHAPGLRQRLGLDSYETVLVYCPTWRDEVESVRPFSTEFLPRLDSWLQANDSVLLIKKHPLDAEIVVAEHERIRDITRHVSDVQDICYHADVLITDYSSIAFDYCLTERPIIFYCYDHTAYVTKCRGMIYDYFETLPGPFVRSEQELLDRLHTLDTWFSSGTHQKRYRRFIDRFNTFRDGRSTARLVDYLERVLSQAPPRRPRYVQRVVAYLRHGTALTSAKTKDPGRGRED